MKDGANQMALNVFEADSGFISNVDGEGNPQTVGWNSWGWEAEGSGEMGWQVLDGLRGEVLMAYRFRQELRGECSELYGIILPSSLSDSNRCMSSLNPGVLGHNME